MTRSQPVTVNQVHLVGRLCYPPNQYPVPGKPLKVAFRLAVPRSGTRKLRDWHMRSADLITVVLYGRPAHELCQRQLTEGDWISVRGHLSAPNQKNWQVVARTVKIPRWNNG